MPFERINLDKESLTKLSSGEIFFNSLENVLNLLPDGREKFYALHYLELTHTFYAKAIEREYVEKKHSEVQSQTQIPTPIPTPVPKPQMSPEAQLLAENVAGLENLKGALQDLTNHVATKGLNINLK